MKVTTVSGFYRITVSVAAAQPSDVKLIGTSGAEVEEMFLLEMRIESQIGSWVRQSQGSGSV